MTEGLFLRFLCITIPPSRCRVPPPFTQGRLLTSGLPMSLRGRQGSPRSSSLAERLTSGGAGDALLPICVPTICYMDIAASECRAIRRIFKRGAHFFSSAPSCKYYKPCRPQKKFPGAGPRAYRICNTICISGGLCREGLGGEPSKAGLFKVFHIKRLVEGSVEAKKAPLCKGSCQRS